MLLPYYFEKSLKKAIDTRIKITGAEDEYEKWHLQNDLFADILDIVEKNFALEKDNFDRLAKHLDKISDALDVEWIDGDFLINDALEIIKKY